MYDDDEIIEQNNLLFEKLGLLLNLNPCAISERMVKEMALKMGFGEIESMQFLIANYLQIKTAEAIEELGMHVEPEYNMSAEDVKKLMLEGSLDAFLDCLDFAPEGVIQIIKDLAVNLPLNDVAKRKAIKDKTQFDVDRAIANIQAEKAAELAEKGGENAESGAKQRRVQPEEKPAGRRTTPNYKVVNEE